MLVLIEKVAGHLLMIAESSHSVTVTKQSIAGTQQRGLVPANKFQPKPMPDCMVHTIQCPELWEALAFTEWLDPQL